jgi:hypothetical protein
VGGAAGRDAASGSAPWEGALGTRATIALAGAATFGIGLPFGVNDSVHWASRVGLVLLATVVPLLVRDMSVPRIATHLIVGATAGATVYIFATGPGNLWPIAIVYFAWSATPPVVIGSAFGFLLGRIGRTGAPAG